MMCATTRTNRWDPLAELWQGIDRVLDAPIGVALAAQVGSPARPPLNVWEDGDDFHLEAELPGVKMEDIELVVEDNRFTLKGNRREDETEDRRFHLRERAAAPFTRVLELPCEIDADRAAATLQDGVLRVTLPKAAPARARRVEVKCN